MLIGGENQIPAKGTVGERSRLTNHVSGRCRPRQRQHAECPGIRDGCRQFGNCRHRRLDDRVFDAEQLTDWRSHQYLLLVHSGPQNRGILDARRVRLRRRASTCCYDSYDVGIDCFACLFQP